MKYSDNLGVYREEKPCEARSSIASVQARYSPTWGENETPGKRCGLEELDQAPPTGWRVGLRRSPAACLDRILVRQCRDPDSLLAVVQLMPRLLEAVTGVRGIFIDSLAQPFRFCDELSEAYTRPGLLYRLLNMLNQLAHKHRLAVLLTNQVTTKVSSLDDSFRLIPALGESWESAVNTRIWLKADEDVLSEDYDPGRRTACLHKSVLAMPSARAYFRISAAGITDP